MMCRHVVWLFHTQGPKMWEKWLKGATAEEFDQSDHHHWPLCCKCSQNSHGRLKKNKTKNDQDYSEKNPVRFAKFSVVRCVTAKTLRVGRSADSLCAHCHRVALSFTHTVQKKNRFLLNYLSKNDRKAIFVTVYYIYFKQANNNR